MLCSLAFPLTNEMQRHDLAPIMLNQTAPQVLPSQAHNQHAQSALQTTSHLPGLPKQPLQLNWQNTLHPHQDKDTLDDAASRGGEQIGQTDYIFDPN
jgi:hypothetical protein